MKKTAVPIIGQPFLNRQPLLKDDRPLIPHHQGLLKLRPADVVFFYPNTFAVQLSSIHNLSARKSDH